MPESDFWKLSGWKGVYLSVILLNQENNRIIGSLRNSTDIKWNSIIQLRIKYFIKIPYIPYIFDQDVCCLPFRQNVLDIFFFF